MGDPWSGSLLGGHRGRRGAVVQGYLLAAPVHGVDLAY